MAKRSRTRATLFETNHLEPADQVLARLQARGLTFHIEGGLLWVNPAGVLSQEDRLAIESVKPDLVRLVRGSDASSGAAEARIASRLSEAAPDFAKAREGAEALETGEAEVSADAGEGSLAPTPSSLTPRPSPLVYEAAGGEGAAANSAADCPYCWRKMSRTNICWKCCNRLCTCGRMTGSAFLVFCWVCECNRARENRS